MKFAQLVEYNNRNILFKNHAENKAVPVIPDLFLLFKKSFYKVKASGLQLNFNILTMALNLP